jgi:ADP-ribose pyrophosphatase YjhB (NUDIX family)
MTDDREPFVGKITQKAILFGPDGDVLVTSVDDHWEPPGGTFEFGETLGGGLRRELREELDLDAVVGPPVVRRLARQRDREPHGDARLPL